MKFNTSLIVSSAIGAALLALVGNQLPQAELVANNSVFTTFSDVDNDGLDDALEARWGTLDSGSDSDQDQLTDLDELLLGTDPLTFDDLVRLDPPQPTLRVDSYVCDTDLVVEIMTLHKNQTNNVRFYWADDVSFQEVPRSTLRGLPFQKANFSSIIPGYSTQVIKLSIPRANVEALGTVAFGIEAFVDGVPCGDQVRYSFIDTELVEWRDSGAAFSRYSGNSSGGGLFPVDPSGSMPGEVTPGEVCIQTLSEVASVGSGQKLYQVSDSYCDYLPSAQCFVGCGASIGDTVVGIDIVGLLAN
ncbi:MAG: hypothetical protein H8E25_09690 [Planctomycetes bacterium]|nr:hypothetical protein [Planctomycetota bacterium]